MLFGKKEDEVAELISEHAKYVQKCLHYFEEGIESYLNDNLCTCEDVMKNITKYEHKADEVRRDVQMKLYDGAFMPLYREDIYYFIDKFDNIADESKHIMNDFILEKPNIPDDLSDDFFQLLKGTISPFGDLMKALNVFKDDKKETLAWTLEIEKKESMVDKIEHDLRKRIFEHNKLRLAEKIHLRTYTLHLAKISDLVEDCSDILEMMIVKRQL